MSRTERTRAPTPQAGAIKQNNQLIDLSRDGHQTKQLGKQNNQLGRTLREPTSFFFGKGGSWRASFFVMFCLTSSLM